MITKPTFIIDEIKCKRNIKKILQKTETNNLIFRPHFKTHQSIKVGQWFKELGVDKITVSSVEMAQLFSNNFKDITLAFPVNILEIETINQLAQKITLNLLIESTEAIQFLSEHLKTSVNFFIKIDVGYHRTGVAPTNKKLIEDILATGEKSSKLKFNGFLSHAGHSYACRNTEDVLSIHKQSLEIMQTLKNNYKSSYPDLILSLGDTPSCSISNEFEGVDEIRPGNFVFYDVMQTEIGSCKEEDIAVAVACPIVAIHHERNNVILYGGGVHFSKEGIATKNHGTIYGLIAQQKNDKWGTIIPNAFIKSLSQEHGIVQMSKDEIAKLNIGDLLMVLPIHSCMTANLMKNDIFVR